MSDRAVLEEANLKFKKSIEKEFNDMEDQAELLGKNALIIGGALITGLLFSSLLKDESKEKGKKKKKFKQSRKNSVSHGLLLDTIKEEALIALLSIASERLNKFLQSLEKESK